MRVFLKSRVLQMSVRFTPSVSIALSKSFVRYYFIHKCFWGPAVIICQVQRCRGYKMNKKPHRLPGTVTRAPGAYGAHGGTPEKRSCLGLPRAMGHVMGSGAVFGRQSWISTSQTQQGHSRQRKRHGKCQHARELAISSSFVPSTMSWRGSHVLGSVTGQCTKQQKSLLSQSVRSSGRDPGRKLSK